ncbi:MAG: hypothetical protein ACO21G_11240, partial [Algoriphagus sp.]
MHDLDFIFSQVILIIAKPLKSLSFGEGCFSVQEFQSIFFQDRQVAFLQFGGTDGFEKSEIATFFFVATRIATSLSGMEEGAKI